MCDEVIVAVGAVAPPMPEDVQVLVVRDPFEDEGPLAGLAGALPEVETAFAVVIGGDMPDVSVAVLGLMIATIEEDEDIEIVALQDGEKVRPLPCVLRTVSATAKVAAMVDSGERRLRSLLSELRVAAVPEAIWRILDPSGGSLRDVDHPGDMPA